MKTMKEKVLEFVESKGTASYTEIIKFVVDTKFGKGTYDSGKGKYTVHRYSNDNTFTPVKTNCWRGYYSGAFSGRNPYFLMGKNRLERYDKKYKVVRGN